MTQSDDSTLTSLFRIEVLTPTHVGGASENHWQPGLDFIAQNSKTWILDFEKLYDHFSPEKLSRSMAQEQGSESLQTLLKNENLARYSTKSFPVVTSFGEIKRHIFSGMDGKPYLPGSSLKGSVSSILLSYFYENNNLRGGAGIVKNVLGDFENSIMRFFQFTDAAFAETRLINTKIFNLQKNNGRTWEGGWKHGRNSTTDQFSASGFTTTYECLAPGQQANLTVSFKQKAIAQLYDSASAGNHQSLPPRHTAGWLTAFSFEKFLEVVNNHTLNFLRKEIAFLEKYTIDRHSESALECLKNLTERARSLDASRECILRLAAGSGFHSITGDWQEDDFIETGEHDWGTKAGKRKYKSRKLAFAPDKTGQWEFWPMGFVKLTLIRPEDLERIEKERADKEKAVARAAEAARLQAEAAAEAIRAAEEAARQPVMFTGIVRKNSEIDAEIVKSGKPNLVKLFIEGQDKEPVPMHGYTSPEPVGTVMIVTPNEINDKKGKVLSVRYKKFK